MSEACSIQSRLHDVALDVEPDDVLRVLLGFVGVGGELDATCLAATAGEHLGLDDDGATEHLGGLTRLTRRRRERVRRRRGSRACRNSSLPWYS